MSLKVIAKQGEDYLVKIPKKELLELVFGEDYPEYNNALSSQVKDLINKCDNGEVAIEISKEFKRIMALKAFPLDGSSGSLIYHLERIIELFTPIRDMITEIKNA